MTTLENCRYVRLPTQRSFRLLKITNKATPVELSLQIFEIGSHPKYTALSYTWGHPVSEDYPGTGGHEVHHPFPYQELLGKQTVTLNLHDALLQLQKSGYSGYLWIDAISIDQSSSEEKTHQVNMMREIYENATSVLIWLGKEDESTPMVTKVLRKLAVCAKNAPLNSGHDAAVLRMLDMAGELDHPHTLERLGIPNLDDDEETALTQFLTRRWFWRVWIVQEVAVAKRAYVRWGSFTTSWETLSASLNHWGTSSHVKVLWRPREQLPKMRKAAPMGQTAIIREMSDFASGKTRSTLPILPLEAKICVLHEQSNTGAIFMMILRQTRSFCAKDARDKVFGLLGVIKRAARVRNLSECPISADYSKSVAQVYEEATTYILKNTSDLLPLSMVSGPSRVLVKDLPSWAIDFSVQFCLSLGESNAMLGDLPDFDAAKGSPKVLEYATIRGRAMYVFAHILDKVADTGEAPTEVINTSLEPYVKFTRSCPKIYRNGQHPVEVLWRTLIWDYGLTGSLHPASDACGVSFRYWLAFIICNAIRHEVRKGRVRSNCFLEMQNLEGLAVRDPRGNIPRLDEIQEICEDNGVFEDGLDPKRDTEQVPFRIRDRGDLRPDFQIPEFSYATKSCFSADPRIHRTHDGYIGSGPFSTCKGDVVIIAAGGKIPFMLRRVGPPEDMKFQLLGDTYVHGIMHGEALRSPGVEWKWLQLV